MRASTRLTRLTGLLAAIAVAAATMVTAPVSQAAPASGRDRAVVIVSGGNAVSPFTTPTKACRTGLSAGNTDTGPREYLLKRGFAVYTAPAMDQRLPVVEPDAASFGAFGDCPKPLPQYMTITSNADIDNAGEHLAHFANYLHRAYGVDDIDWVTHSNGGLFARAATRVLQDTKSPVKVRSLLTLGTPWMGTFPLRIVYGEVPESTCLDDARCLALYRAMKKEAEGDLGLARENTYQYLTGPGGWNAAQGGVLKGIPVHLIAGTYLTNPNGDPELWPFDGLVSEYSALVKGVPTDVLGRHSCASFPVTHSIYIANELGLPWSNSLTWGPGPLRDMANFLRLVQQGKDLPAGNGCTA